MSFFKRLWSSGELGGRDNPELSEYAQAMAEGRPYIRLKLDVPEAIELGAFVGAFTALASEYDRHMRDRHPETAPEASLYVRDVQRGSIVALLIPLAPMFPDVANAVGQIVSMEDFVRRYGGRLSNFLKPNAPVEATKSELRDFTEQVAAIANTAGSTLEIAAVEIENGEHRVRAAFTFNTGQARTIQDRAELARKTLEHTSRSDRSRVLMVFTRSDVRNAPLGKRSGEQVVIEDISDQRRPLVYASDLAEQQIKHEITDAEDNVYKKGFVVDVNIETRGGKPIAYAVTALHQVIDLPDDED
jgi:hypothetical protein